MEELEASLRRLSALVVAVAVVAACGSGAVPEAENLAKAIRERAIVGVERVSVREIFLDDPVVEVYLSPETNDEEAAIVWCEVYGTSLFVSLHRRPPALLRRGGAPALDPVPGCVPGENGYVPAG